MYWLQFEKSSKIMHIAAGLWQIAFASASRFGGVCRNTQKTGDFEGKVFGMTKAE
jgi:hypothetical protein